MNERNEKQPDEKPGYGAAGVENEFLELRRLKPVDNQSRKQPHPCNYLLDPVVEVLLKEKDVLKAFQLFKPVLKCLLYGEGREEPS